MGRIHIFTVMTLMDEEGEVHQILYVFGWTRSRSGN